MKTCFFVSPIGDPGSDERKNSDRIMNYIVKPVCEGKGYQTKRADDFRGSHTITETILRQLRESDLVIAEVTNPNPNVYFETGYRWCTGKATVLLNESGNRLPFDIDKICMLFYSVALPEHIEHARGELSRFIDAELERVDNNHQNTQISTWVGTKGEYDTLESKKPDVVYYIKIKDGTLVPASSIPMRAASEEEALALSRENPTAIYFY